MRFEKVTYHLKEIDDPETFERLPLEMQTFLQQVNGMVALGGGIHFRGCCLSPSWHSIREAWMGECAFHKDYDCIRSSDIPFAQDCMGDQFFWRDGQVIRLLSETDELELLHVGFNGFLRNVQEDPVNYLKLKPLQEFEGEQQKALKPGQLLNVYPPYCLQEKNDKYRLKAVSVEDRLDFLADLARKIRNLPRGRKLRIKPID
jgi:hypothetical protein